MQPYLVGQRLHVADRDRAVGDCDRDIDQHPPRVVTRPADPQTVHGPWLGRVQGTRHVGLNVILTFVDVLHRVSLRIVTMPIQAAKGRRLVRLP